MPDIDEQPAPTPQPEHRPARRRRVLNKERIRQERRRDEMKAAGAPETHRVNSAISEGLSFAIASHKRAGTFTPELQHFAAMVGASATTVLVERKHCARDASKAAVLKQMRRRSDHVAGSVLKLPPTQVDDR